MSIAGQAAQPRAVGLRRRVYIMDDLFSYQEKWKIIVDKYFTIGVDALTPLEKVWYYCEEFIASMDDGGISSYFYNHAGENYFDALKSLEIIKATQTKKLLQIIGDLFPNRKPSKDISERNDIVASWEGKEDRLINEVDSKYRKQNEKPEELLVKYLQENGIFPE